MGLETRNESPEQPESVERNPERESVEKDSPELVESETEDVNDDIDDPKTQETLEEDKRKEAAENEEDFSDVPEENSEGVDSEEIERTEEIATEDFADPNDEPYTPEQMESHNGLDSIAKEYVGRDLTDEDKQELSDRQYEYLKERRPEDRDDCRVPTPESVKSVTEGQNGILIKKDFGDGDGAIEGTEHSEIVQKGSIIDRYGAPDGKYACPLKEDGTPYTIKERATGDRTIEPDIEDNSAYHQYEVNTDLSKENMYSALDAKFEDGSLDEKVYERYKMTLESYYEDSRYFDEQPDGIKTSTVKELFDTGDNPDGGATQYVFPFKMSEMEKLELISETDDNE